ncbi:MAG: inositol monophosphatase [Bacteroidia bacterium]|nr:inositol monophosphatase [Bacteroidia bacterium]
MINLPAIEQNVSELCSEVGEFILTECGNFDKSRIEQKEGISNLVSYVDKESEKRIVKALESILPGAGFLAEEGTDKKGTNDYQWIIDPLDGTTNFTHGLPPFAISIGLAKSKKMVCGVILEVTKGECFHASLDNPAFLNEKVIHVSPVKSLSESLLATGFPYYHFDKIEAYLEIIKIFLQQTHGIRRLGSAATDLAYVACGRLDGFFEYNLNAWDVAAGSFIVEQAGGKVTDFRGGDNHIFGGELCAGNAIQQEMLDIIQRNWR